MLGARFCIAKWILFEIVHNMWNPFFKATWCVDRHETDGVIASIFKTMFCSTRDINVRAFLCLKPVFALEVDRQIAFNYIEEMSFWMFVNMRAFGIWF